MRALRIGFMCCAAVLATSAVAVPLHAQVQTKWITTLPGATASDLFIDALNQIYVVGTQNPDSADADQLVVKLGSNGDTIWTRLFAGSTNGYDDGRFIAEGPGGSAVVVGRSPRPGPDSSSNHDIVTSVYASDGSLSWSRRYANVPSRGYSEASALVMDAEKHAFVAGFTQNGSSDTGGTGADYLIIKYDHDGDSLWVRSYDGPGNDADEAAAAATSSNGAIVVTGYSEPVGAAPDIATLLYDSLGTLLWERRYDGPGNGNDGGTSVAIDSSGNIYIAGYSSTSPTDYGTVLIKYDPAGDTLWVRHEPNQTFPSAISIAPDGGALLCGYENTVDQDDDLVVLRYSSDGQLQWTQFYDNVPPAGIAATGLDLVTDGSGRAYATGNQFDLTLSVGACVTVAFDSAGGELWAETHSSNSDGVGRAIEVGPDGGIVVVGGEGSIVPELLAIKYAPCNCDCHADPAGCNGVQDITDVVQAVNVAFRGAPAIEDPNSECPLETTDVNCSMSTDVLDVVRMVNVAFRGADAATEFCDPCA